VIRPLEPADIDQVIPVWLASTIPGQAFLPEEHWRAMETDVRDELLPIAETWVVEDDGELVAFMSIIGDLIGGLFTHPDHQGRGHGSALIEHARRHYDPVYVEVFEANEKAIGFYRSCGFVDHESRVDEESGLNQLILRLAERPPLLNLDRRPEGPADR
jgi:putative acetyltransferase